MPELNPPIKGINAAVNPDKQPPLTTDYMDNVWPADTLEKRIRLGQRPGVDKAFAQQIGGAAVAIVAVNIITTVD